METMLHFTTDQIRAGLGEVAQAEVSILDIGTGNGVLPLELAALGYSTVTGASCGGRESLFSKTCPNCSAAPC